jgi:hypothetical protein
MSERAFFLEEEQSETHLAYCIRQLVSIFRFLQRDRGIFYGISLKLNHMEGFSFGKGIPMLADFLSIMDRVP